MNKSGQSSPLGATIVEGGVNFSIFSRNATAVELLLFNHADDRRPAHVIRLDPVTNRTYHYWHVMVPELYAGQIYAYSIQGPFDPANGMRFDSSRILLDPYGRGVAVPPNYNRDALTHAIDQISMVMKSVVVDTSVYDWEGDQPIRRPSSQTIIYEMHVRGFTRHPSSGLSEKLRGTYRGLIEKIPYLKDLNITAVELLPVFQFDEQFSPPGLVNYWGYQPISFFAPHVQYSSRRDPISAINEFRDMVKALHRAGIEVILDVVFNHTAEGGQAGPTFSFKGIDNSIYYLLAADRASYADFSGCGNSLNANNPVVRRMIVDSLRYWVEEMHVDGFRFDLASILARNSSGEPIPVPPVLWDIESDPVLAGTKLIAEAWDAAGLYQVGSFIGDSWKEWNGRFRDDVRKFFRGDVGSISLMASRLLGSPDIYGHEERDAEQSLNFVTCHDGFTLNDLVSYNVKHNEANLEENRDGMDENFSWNCGFEGPTSDPDIERLRNRQVKNFLTVTLLALGVPMTMMGDEVRRTQGGNNNAYCQDNETNWLDWSLIDKHEDVYRFFSQLAARRLLRDLEPERQRLSLNRLLQGAKISWHGIDLDKADWSDGSRSLAVSFDVRKGKLLLHLILNSYSKPLEFKLPQLPSPQHDPWRRWIDTALDSPDDISDWRDALWIPGFRYRAEPHSVVALFAYLDN